MNFKYEIELIDEFCNYLEENKIEYKREISMGYPHNKSCIDIVTRKDNDLIGIEAKIKHLKGVLLQALGNRVFTPFNYILWHQRPKPQRISNIKRVGIGLFIYNSNIETFEKLLDPIKCDFTMKDYYNRLKKNWNSNRIRREYNKKELPINYDMDNLRMYSEKWEKVEIMNGKQKVLEEF